MKKAKVFLIVGNTGAGKSTHAAQWAKREHAHIFSVDEWMKSLFMQDMPDPPSYAWALERTERTESQMLSESIKLLKLKVNIILDIGFFSIKQRKRVREFFLHHGVDPIVHYLDVDKETRWQRVNHRNTEQSETYQFDVSRDVFEFCETIFEPLTEDEQKLAVIPSASG